MSTPALNPVTTPFRVLTGIQYIDGTRERNLLQVRRALSTSPLWTCGPSPPRSHPPRMSDRHPGRHPLGCPRGGGRLSPHPGRDRGARLQPRTPTIRSGGSSPRIPSASLRSPATGPGAASIAVPAPSDPRRPAPHRITQGPGGGRRGRHRRSVAGADFSGPPLDPCVPPQPSRRPPQPPLPDSPAPRPEPLETRHADQHHQEDAEPLPGPRAQQRESDHARRETRIGTDPPREERPRPTRPISRPDVSCRDTLPGTCTVHRPYTGLTRTLHGPYTDLTLRGGPRPGAGPTLSQYDTSGRLPPAGVPQVEPAVPARADDGIPGPAGGGAGSGMPGPVPPPRRGPPVASRGPTAPASSPEATATPPPLLPAAG